MIRIALFIAITITLSLINPCQAAISFDGSNDYIDLGNDPSLVSDEYTWSAWVKPSDLSILRGVLMRGGPAGDPPYNNHLSLDSNGSAYYVIELGPGNYEISSDIGDITVGSWSHVVASFRKNARAKLFIDGVFKDDVAVPNISPTQYNLYISNAAVYAPWGDDFAGDMEDLRIYNRELSNGEVFALYNSRSKRPSGSLANGLVAHYEMDDKKIGHLAGQAQDSSGNLNHGEFVSFENLVSNGFSNDVPSQVATGTSLEFDGIDDYVIINNSVDSSQQGAISLWFKSTDTATNANFISSADEGTNNHYWLLRLDTGAVELLTHDGTTAEGIKTNSSGFNDGNWHNVTFVSDGSSYTCYVDGGSEAMTGNNTGRWLGDISLRDNLTLGNRVQNTILNYYDGYIDKVHVYNKTLSSTEISYLYNGSGLDPGTSNLQALWTFDDDSAIKDSSGNDNHGLGSGGDSLKYTDSILKR